jgi:hypothetical protein
MGSAGERTFCFSASLTKSVQTRLIHTSIWQQAVGNENAAVSHADRRVEKETARRDDEARLARDEIATASTADLSDDEIVAMRASHTPPEHDCDYND